MTTPILEKPIPPVPSAQTLDSRGSTISQPWQQWFINLRDKVNQINGVVVAISGSDTTLGAFNTLSPLTTTGDMLTYGSGNNTRLPIGSTGQILAVVSGMPAWVNPSAGSTPLTTKGDLYGYNTAPARIPVGTDSYVLTADSSNPLGVSWKPAGTPTLPVTTKGDLLGYSTLPARIPVGADGQALLADSTQALGVRWGATGSSSPLTAKGDLYGFSTINARIPVGIDGQVLTANSTNANGVVWGNPFSSYITPTFSNVSSLLHFNGTNGSTTFTDQVAGNTWVANNATISTTKSLFGGTSGYFNGASNSSIHLPTNSGFNVGSGNFTIEFAVYYAALPQNGMHLFQTRDGDVYSGISIEGNITANNNMYLYMSSTGTSYDILSNILIGTVPLSIFTRFLIQRSGSILSVYQDGLLTYTSNIGTASIYYNSSDLIVLGGNYTGVSRSLNGYIDEFRFTKGQALVSQYSLATSEFPNS